MSSSSVGSSNGLLIRRSLVRAQPRQPILKKGGTYASSIFSQRHALWSRNGALRCLTIFNGKKA